MPRMLQRVIWTDKLHQKFLDAYNHLGHGNATPKEILKLMNEPGLTHKNVNSHLQKYRDHLRRLGEIPQGRRNMNRSYGSITGQDQNVRPSQSLTQFQIPSGLVQPSSLTEPRISVSPLMDQRSIFNFENPTITYGYGDRHMMMNNGTTQMLTSFPTGAEPNQFASSEYMCVQRQSTAVWPGPNVQSSGMLLPVAHQPSMLPRNSFSSVLPTLYQEESHGQNQEQGVAEAVICPEQYFQEDLMNLNTFLDQMEELIRGTDNEHLLDNPLGDDEFNFDMI